jgi:cytochrome P450
VTDQTARSAIERCPVAQQGDYNPFEPAFLNDPMAALKPMREEMPVFFSEVTGMWCVTRYDDVITVIRDLETYSSNAFRQIKLSDEAEALFPYGVPGQVPTLTNGDPPAHRRIRKLANQSFTRPRMAAMEPAIKATVDELLDDLVPRGECELISEFSSQVPAALFCDILDVSRDYVPRILAWATRSWSR